MNDHYHYRLLLIEDSLADVRLTCEALQFSALGASSTLEYALSGEEGIAAMEKDTDHPFDTIILDLSMPRINGIQLLTYMKSSNSNHSSPIIVLTNSDSQRDKIECMRLGADAFFIKPLDFDRLIYFFSALSMAFDEKHALSISSIQNFCETN